LFFGCKTHRGAPGDKRNNFVFLYSNGSNKWLSPGFWGYKLCSLQSDYNFHDGKISQKYSQICGTKVGTSYKKRRLYLQVPSSFKVGPRSLSSLRSYYSGYFILGRCYLPFKQTKIVKSDPTDPPFRPL